MSRFREDPARLAAERLHATISARARAPVFYRRFAVPDTLDGRFDLLVLHAFFVLERLKAGGAQGKATASALVTRLFVAFDETLRELGVGDFGIARRIKAMASAFYGRLEAYAAAIGEEGMARAVRNNVYRGDARFTAEAEALAAALRAAAGPLTGDALARGEAAFGPLPADKE